MYVHITSSCTHDPRMYVNMCCESYLCRRLVAIRRMFPFVRFITVYHAFDCQCDRCHAGRYLYYS